MGLLDDMGDRGNAEIEKMKAKQAAEKAVKDAAMAAEKEQRMQQALEEQKKRTDTVLGEPSLK